MKEFALIFRSKDITDLQPSPEQMQERMNWLGSITAQNKLVDKGNTLLPMPGKAKTVKPENVVTNGHYTEIRKYISDYVVIKANPEHKPMRLIKKAVLWRWKLLKEIMKLCGSIAV